MTVSDRHPFTGRAKHCLCWIEEPFSSRLLFLGKQNLKLALHQIVARPFIRPRFCPGHLLQGIGSPRLGTVPAAQIEFTAATADLPDSTRWRLLQRTLADLQSVSHSRSEKEKTDTRGTSRNIRKDGKMRNSRHCIKAGKCDTLSFCERFQIMRRSLIVMVVLSVSIILTGCTHVQLRRITLNQETTLTDLQFKQVMDNLAMFVHNPATLPYFALSSSGTSQVADTEGPATGSLAWSPTSGTVGFGATRQLTEGWGLAPIMDPDKLDRMRCAYQAVIGIPNVNCDDCLKKLQDFFGPNVNLAERLPKGWFGSGKKKDAPRNACYVGQYCGTFVWVLPEGIDGLTRFTLTILDLATGSPPPPPLPVTVVTTRDKDGNVMKTETTETKSVYGAGVYGAGVYGAGVYGGMAPGVPRFRDIPRIPAVPTYVPSIPR